MAEKDPKEDRNAIETVKRNSDDLAYVSTATRKVLWEIVGNENIHSISGRMSFSYEYLRRALREPEKPCNPTVMFLTNFAGAKGYSAEEVFQRIGKEIDEEKERQGKEAKGKEEKK